MTNEDVKILRMISGNCNLEKVQRDMLKRIADREEEPEFRMRELTEEEIKNAKELMKTTRIEPIDDAVKISFEQRLSFEVDNAITGFIEERITEEFPWAREFVFNTNNIADAMRKQVEKKPEVIMLPMRVKAWKCSECGMILGTVAEKMDRTNYCKRCGKKISWENK